MKNCENSKYGTCGYTNETKMTWEILDKTFSFLKKSFKPVNIGQYGGSWFEKGRDYLLYFSIGNRFFCYCIF